ncbi:unnamed protein product [Closterium sp. Yama58-4]|nr:unnamed protein product [Closterium sp. Yama58-4]
MGEGTNASGIASGAGAVGGGEGRAEFLTHHRSAHHSHVFLSSRPSHSLPSLLLPLTAPSLPHPPCCPSPCPHRCDKLGVHHSPSVVVFAGLQRLFMAVPPVLYLAATRPSAFPLLLQHFPLLAGISACEITAIVFYLQSLHWLLVSYSVAAKRSNILISMFVGYFLFKENIWKRLPYVLLMIAGMTLIIFAA